MENSLESILKEVMALNSGLEVLHAKSNEAQVMKAISEELKPIAENLRIYCDMAETCIADDLWPLPKYREMLFLNNQA